MSAGTPRSNGKIGVLIESHFDEHEYRRFNEYFPSRGYEVEYISHLWNQPQLTFTGNDFTEHAAVSVEVNAVDPAAYKGIILIGGYAMDRLRYQEHPRKGQPNRSPAVSFLRRAVAVEGLRVGTICHSLWLFCAAPSLLKGRRVTCAHNIIPDVRNAGGIVVYDGDQTVDVHIDGNLITGRHPGVVDEFMQVFLREIEGKGAVKRTRAA